MFVVIWLYQMMKRVPISFFLAAYALTRMSREFEEDVFANSLGDPDRTTKSKSGLRDGVGFFHLEIIHVLRIARLGNNNIY